MSEQSLPLLSAALIRGYMTSGTYDKGRAYQVAGNVLELEVEEDRQGKWLILASVRGSGRNVYDVVVGCITQPNDSLLPVSSSCSCPVEVRCKHAAAVLIELLHNRNRLKPADVGWRTGIRALLPQPEPVSSSGTIALALLFEIKQQRHGGHYGSRPATETFLSVRIGAPSLTGNGRWAMNRVSWQDIVGKTRQSGQITSTHKDTLQTLWSLYAANNRSDYYDYYGTASMIKLDRFASNRLWSLLDEARSAGIPLLTTANGNPPIHFGSACAIELGISEQASGDLQLAPQFVVDGRAAPKALQLRLIGDPPIGAYWSQGPAYSLKQHELYLGRFAEPPNGTLLKAFRDKASLDIPAADKEEFSRAYFPQIARRNPVNTERVTSIKLETPEPPKLYLAVGRAKPHGVRTHIGFAYQEDGKQTIMPYHTEGGSAIIRDAATERRLVDKLSARVAGNPAWFEEIPSTADGAATQVLRPDITLHGLDAVHFITEAVPEFQKSKDTIMYIDPNVPDYRELEGAPSISYEVTKRDGSGSQDWFNLGIEVTVGDVTIPFEPLFAALAENETSLMLDDGKYLMLSHPELLKLRQLIIEARQLGDKESSDLSISRFQAGLWDELQQLGIVKAQSEAWESAVRGLLDVKSVPKVPVPKNLRATLRPYQKEGFQWLHFLWTHRLGGILADDMGLGKTLQTVALILVIKAATPAKDRRPILIVAPTSVAANWQHELAHFAPSLTVACVRKVAGSNKQLAKEIKHADLVVSSYGLFRLDFDAYAAQSWTMLVLDEAQFVKNHQSKGYQNARKLPAEFKLTLTGTPLENNLMELWALLSIVAPGLFPSPKHFTDFYQKPIEKDADNDKLKQLRQRVRPLMLRRTKEQVVRELPPKIEQVIELELEPQHRKIYDTYLQRERQRVLGLLGDIDKNRFMIFKSLTTLRLLSLAPSLVDAKKYAKVPSTKLRALSKQLQEILGENHRVLIFSQFTSFLKMVQAELRAQNIQHCYLDGSTTNRAALLENFKTGGAPVFLISLKAGGFGLNLTEADYCILLDPWWNPAAETQAVDRAHRIGQTRQVIVYRLVAKDTIEEKVMALKAKKSKLFASVLDENATFGSQITADDIQQLFM
jgi:superfamily II DNA or RNA helicase